MTVLRRLTAALLLAVLVTCVLAACGGHKHCTSSNYSMQCVHVTAPAAPTATPGEFGVDTYGAGNPAIGASFDCSYLSGTPGGKDWTASALFAWHRVDKTTCIVWETSATRALDGYAAGRADALTDAREARELGIPSYAAERFAVDTDTSGASVEPFAEGWRSVWASESGVYGSYYVVVYLEAHGLTSARTDWQTLAWSNGLRSDACLYQSSIDDVLDGESVDFDHASCADFGQFPYAQPPARPVCFGRHAQGSATCRSVHADVRRLSAAADATWRVIVVRGCLGLTSDQAALQRRWDWFHGHLATHPHIRRAHREAALHATERALRHVRDDLHVAQCGLFGRRWTYFQDRATHIEKEYS